MYVYLKAGFLPTLYKGLYEQFSSFCVHQ